MGDVDRGARGGFGFGLGCGFGLLLACLVAFGGGVLACSGVAEVGRRVSVGVP